MSDGDWFDYKPGVKVRRLGDEGGDGFYLVRMEPGAVMPKDAHPQRETSVVLEGAVMVDTWPASDTEGRRHSDAFGSVDPDSDHAPRRIGAIDIGSDVHHSLRAHPQRGVLLLTVARPDWPAA